MKIAILPLGHRRLPTDGAAIFAPGVLAYRAAEVLTERGHHVDVFAPEESQIKANVISLGLSSMFAHFGEKKSSDPGMYISTLLQYELYLASYLIEHSQEYDIIHAHDYRKLMYLSRFARCPIVYSYHGNPHDDATLDIDKKRFARYYDNNFFIAASQKQKDLGRQYFNFAGVVPHGVDADKIPFSSSGGENLLYIGRLMRRKRPDIAIKIAAQLGKRITIIGAGQPGPEDESYFQQELAPYMNQDYVHNLGVLPYNDVFPHLSQAKALLLPIEWEEPFGMVMIEAMAAGTPVIAFGLGSVPEIVRNGETGYIIEPGNAEAMRAAVEKLYQMPDSEYQQMRQKCRARVEEFYTTNKMVSGFEEIYNKLIQNVRH